MPFSSKERRREYERDRRKNNPEYFLWKSAKKRARDKELEFNIEVSDIIIPQFCPLLNIPIIHTVGSNARNSNSPSLDRFDNRFGYVKDNIIVISWRANFIKSDASLDELKLLLTNWECLSKLT